MLDSISSLAFEMQASKGVFALLVGSGISRTSKIPTGWDITLDLVRSVASLRSEDPGADPAGWYQRTFGKAPNYSTLLDSLATTPTLRQQVIRPYIEPSLDEKNRGEKLPTLAHRAIAQLMTSGHVRVVLTTNFDQLLEQALAELGTKATVVGSADQVAGSLPLVHSGPLIVKLHGDYLDTRIRNTDDELSVYEPPLARLLDQVIDEFGLIVCGWSGEWDVALRAAIDRATSRRFPFVWAARGEPAAAAKALVDRRKGRLIMIDGADQFFDSLQQRIQAIARLQQSHPLSAAIAVEMLKEYLPEPRHCIRLEDLVNEELRRALERIDHLKMNTGLWSSEVFVEQLLQYKSAIEPLLPLAYTAGRWSSEDQARQWVHAVAVLAKRAEGISGVTVLTDLRMLPATLVLYAFGLGAVIGRRTRQLGMMVGKMADFSGTSFALGDRLNISSLIGDGGQDRFRLVTGYQNKRLAGSEFVGDILQGLSRSDLRDVETFNTALARLEMMFSFSAAERMNEGRGDDWFWVPPGRFLFSEKIRNSILEEWLSEYGVKAMKCELCEMAALSKPPRFDDVAKHFGRARLW